jgi:hypothetical protein
MVWYNEIDMRLGDFRSAVLGNQQKLRDDLYAIRNRLLANDLPFKETTYAAAEAVVRTFTKLISTQPNPTIVFAQNQYGAIEDPLKAMSDNPPEHGDLAITEWLRFQIDNLTSDSGQATMRALKLGQALPLVAILVFPPELFRIDYRKELTRIKSDDDQTRRRLSELEVINRKRRRGSIAARLLRIVYAYPTAALDSALGLLDPAPAGRPKKKTGPKMKIWKSGIVKRLDTFDKTMQRKGFMPHTRDLEMETYYTDKIQKLNDEKDELYQQLSNECKEALSSLSAQQQLSS